MSKMSETKFTIMYDKEGRQMRVPVRAGLSDDDPRARYVGFCPETRI